MSFENPQEMGGSIAILDEDITISDKASSINFKGSGISGSAIGSDVTENVPGSGSASTPVDEALTDSGDHTSFTFPHTPDSTAQITVYNGSSGAIYPSSMYTRVGTNLTFTSSLSVGGETPEVRASYAY